MQNPQYAADFETLIATCHEKKVAVQTIKAITKAPWGDRPSTTATWYEPMQDQSAIDTTMSWVLGREGVYLNTVGDIHILPKVLDAAERFKSRPSDEVMTELVNTWHMEPMFV